MGQSRVVSSAILAIATFLWSTGARANGRYPATGQIVISPSNQDMLILRTTFGLLVSSDGGRDWAWVCESAIGFNGDEDPTIGATSDGSILATLYEGLAVSVDGGCSWGFASALSGLAAADVAVRSDNPHAALSLAWKSTTDDAGLTTFDSRIYRTVDDGAQWTWIGSLPGSTVFPQTLDVATSDSSRVYVSAVRGIYETQGVTLYVSRDGATTFVENTVPIDTKLESGAFIAAVDPSNADRVYLRTWPISRLLVSDDAGLTFASVLSFSGEMQGFALSPDGGTIYAGGPSDGLWVGDAATLQFSQVSSIPVECLATSGAKLFACSSEDAFALGVSIDGGQSFTPLFRLGDLSTVLACPVSSGVAACTAQWPEFCRTTPVCSGPDAGEAGAAPGDGAPGAQVQTEVAPRHDACSCRIPGRATDGVRSRAGAGALTLLAGLAWARRRRGVRASPLGPPSRE
jgi:hypothetical protein